MQIRYFFLLAALTLSSLTAAAQSQPRKEDPESIAPDLPRSSDPGKRPFVREFLHDEYRIWTSPFRPGNYDSHTMRKYVLPFVVIEAALIATDHKSAEALPNTADQTKWSGRVSQVGAAYTLAGMCGAVYLASRVTGNKRGREAGFLGLEAIAHTQILVFGIKQMGQRERPLDNEGGRSFWKGGDSFPSGHAATSFAVAAVFAYEYRDHIAVPITAYTVATAVSLSRLSAQRHWVSDIFAGGSMGFLIGRYVYKQHHDPRLPGSPVNIYARWMPDIGFTERGLTLAWHL